MKKQNINNIKINSYSNNNYNNNKTNNRTLNKKERGLAKNIKIKKKLNLKQIKIITIS